MCQNTRYLAGAALGDWGSKLRPRTTRRRRETKTNYSSSAACSSSRTLYPAAPPRCQHCHRYSVPRTAVSIFQGKSGPSGLFPSGLSSLGALCRIGPWRSICLFFPPLSSAVAPLIGLLELADSCSAANWAAPGSASAFAITGIVTECQGVWCHGAAGVHSRRI